MSANPDLAREADRREHEALTAEVARLKPVQIGIPANRRALAEVQTKRLRLEVEGRA